ncbi:type II toxin-antitoxin system RelE/ParE family toxin [Jannaschia formosa]|uniref:type II toxin-antitoxin system RelE/ParE family toxin n=1 Tax=Jannaschia formosa TaxID=2259592 RepID=UPI000E1BFBC3|nr:type II toxin-antitoxin system RelE/ParE family toxin [Jannaschia formosa]TFL19861.1 excinuclease ABC subunit A [Jannaschia formosa]
MIRSFRDKDSASLAARERVRRFHGFERVALRKLAMIEAATVLDDLRAPPGNRLEALRGDRAGQHSIRINDRWRICFAWIDGEAHDVEICDYH